MKLIREKGGGGVGVGGGRGGMAVGEEGDYTPIATQKIEDSR